MANTTGLSAIDFTMAWLTRLAPDSPQNTSAPRSASASVRNSVWTANRSLYGFIPLVRPL